MTRRPRADTNGWLRVDDLPEFGELPTNEDYERVLGGLDVETLRCKRVASGDAPDVVNILHASSDIDLAEAEITRIVDSMKSWGFMVERKRRLDRWPETDVLILGMNESSIPHVNESLGILARGAGLLVGWSVLLYGIGCMPTLKSDLYGKPLLTGKNFGSDVVCMLHAHIRLRNDLQFWIGYLASMTDVIEYSITHLIKASRRTKSLNDNDSLSCKIDILASMLRKAGVRNQDVELFSCAAHLIRVVRNEFVHFMADIDQPEPRANDIAKHMDNLYDLAERYGRGDLMSGTRGPDAGNVGALGVVTLFYVRLTLLVDRWLLDCLKHRTLLPAEPHED